MTARAAPGRPGVPAVPLLALLAVVVVLAAVLAGNSLARHLAASVLAPAAVATSDEASHHAAPAPALVVPDEQSETPGQAGQHALHAVGACLAVLVTGLLILHADTFARWPRPPSQAACRPRAGPRPVSTWRPRALSPPTLSPVIRT